MKGPKPKPLEERLVDRLDRSGDCWIWEGCTNRAGYGKIGIPGQGQGVTALTHRIAYELFIGPIPDGLFVCHRCDNPPCCNPAHLFLGDQKANLSDMSRKGRARKTGWPGDTHPHRKISCDDVREIRKLCATTKHTLSEIGSMFGVSDSAISHIIARRTWRHVE